jgi:hypothetical protein
MSLFPALADPANEETGAAETSSHPSLPNFEINVSIFVPAGSSVSPSKFVHSLNFHQKLRC